MGSRQQRVVVQVRTDECGQVSLSSKPASTDHAPRPSSLPLLQPIQVLFRHLQQGTMVTLWLYDNLEFVITGKILGFDEFMNVTMSEAKEVYTENCKKAELRGTERELGRILLKGDNIVSIVEGSSRAGELKEVEGRILQLLIESRLSFSLEMANFIPPAWLISLTFSSLCLYALQTLIQPAAP